MTGAERRLRALGWGGAGGVFRRGDVVVRRDGDEWFVEAAGFRTAGPFPSAVRAMESVVDQKQSMRHHGHDSGGE